MEKPKRGQTKFVGGQGGHTMFVGKVDESIPGEGAAGWSRRILGGVANKPSNDTSARRKSPLAWRQGKTLDRIEKGGETGTHHG